MLKYINKQKSGKELFFNYGEITIADECFIGINSSIALNTSIGEGAVVGAHSFVNSNLESFSINVGNPAKNSRQLINLARKSNCDLYISYPIETGLKGFIKFVIKLLIGRYKKRRDTKSLFNQSFFF